MSQIFLEKLFEHNNWANQCIIQACSGLSDEQLDATPRSVTKGTIRATLSHLVSSQHNYLQTLTRPLEERLGSSTVEFHEFEKSARMSGEGLLALAKAEQKPLSSRIQTRDGYMVEPWVVMLQAINHATEHREQIKSMLSDLGITPPEIDGWDFGFATNALVSIRE
jgi:uncharacterized damage-inducible protein DinB